MKKFTINIILIILAIIIYFLQENFFSWFTINGVMPNLFIIFVLCIGLFSKKTMGTVYGIVIGLVLDYLVGTKIGVNAVLLGLVGFLAAVFDKNFSKDSRITIMLLVAGMTIAFEVVKYAISYAVLGTSIEIVIFLKILIVEAIYNVVISIIIYPLMKKYGYAIEEEYRGNKILTRYF